MNTVWVVRNPDGTILDYGTCEEDVYFWNLKSDQRYTITQEFLLTPEMTAVIAAAKAFDDDPISYQPELDLRATVAALRAQENLPL